MKKVWQPLYQRVSTIGLVIVSGGENGQDIDFGIIWSVRLGDGKVESIVRLDNMIVQ